MSLITGPGGSGKTTLLSLIGCLLKPDCGEILWAKQNVAALEQIELAAVRRNIGFLFQEGRLFDSINAVENIMIAMAVCEPPGATLSSALKLLDGVGLRHKAHARMRDLTPGERRLVGLARAMANDPQVLLADEPGALPGSVLRHFTERKDRMVIAAARGLELVPYAHRLLTMSEGVLEEETAQSG